MADSNEIPDKAELERQQLYLTNEKLKIEARKLERESQPEKWWSKLVKNVVAIGGITTVAATAYGLYDSYSKTIRDRERSRATEQHAQFEEAIKKLEASGTISKLVGVSVLSGYLDRNGKALHHQILFTLASLVATEQDLQTQTAVADLIAAIPPETIDEGEWFYFQDILASQSRALMIKGDLYQHRQFGLTGVVPSIEERTARFVSKLISSNVRKGVVKNYSNYAGIYCEGCDFRNAIFPKKSDFTAAVLDRANFTGATLDEASFDNADYGETNFTGAFLRQARFRSLSEKGLRDGLTEEAGMVTTPYIVHVGGLLEERARIALTMPDFSCANLEGARFDNLALFPVAPMAERSYSKADEKKPGWYQTVPSFLKDLASDKSPSKFHVASVRFPQFYKADLRQARLDKARYFTFSEANEFPLKGLSGSTWETRGGFDLHQGTLSKAVLQVTPDQAEDEKAKRPNTADDAFDASYSLTKSERERFQRLLRASFYLANTDQALLPEGVAEFLKNSPPKAEDYQSVVIPFAHDEIDQKCTTRTTPLK